MRASSHTRVDLALAAGLIVVALGALSAPADARSDRDERAKAAQSIQQPQSPLKLIVSIRQQRITVWEGTRKVAEAPISTGKPGHDTPTGIFSVLEKNRVHFSNLYDNAPMPFMQRLTWSGVALHAGALPGYPASHGCIRMPFSFSKQLFNMTRIGARVIVARDEAEPQAVAHPNLPVPLPPAEQIASAPRATPGSGGVETLIGVSRATAAEATAAPRYQPQRTRASVIAERAAEISALANAITKAEANQQLAETRARETAADALRAREAVTDTLAALRSLSAARDAAKRGQTAAEAELRTFGSRNQSAVEAGDEAAIATLIEQEDELERRIEAAIFEVTDLNAEIAERERANTARATEAAEKVALQSAANTALSQARDAVKEAQAAKVTAERRLQRRDMPVTVFISRKTGTLSVRQGFDPLFEAPVRIDNPEQPLGTHVFTALDYNQGGRALAWSVVTVPSPVAEGRAQSRNSQARGQNRKEMAAASEVNNRPATGALLTPHSALTRIHIGADVMERIAEYMRPGSAFLISDLGMSNETGKFTDFVLLTR